LEKSDQDFVATEGMEKFFPADKLMLSGNPVRQHIVDAKVDRKTALEYFKLDEHKITVLAMGGSLGARSINQAIADQIDLFENIICS